MSDTFMSFAEAQLIVNRAAKILYNVGDMQCTLCYGKGYIGYNDDDGYEITTCDCRLKK